MRRWYGLYDDIVGRVECALADEDTILLVSDHGMKASGVDSRRAFYACSKLIWNSHEWRLPDLRSVLEKELRSHDVGQNDSGTSQTINRESRDHVEQLGYF
jgi:hypothetical protein